MIEDKKEYNRRAQKKYYEKKSELIKAKRRLAYVPKKKPTPTTEELLQEAVYYDEEKGYWRRNSNTLCNPKSKNQAVEFLWIIENITKTPFEEFEWVNQERGDEIIDIFDSNDSNMCICSHKIHHSYIIEHKPTKECFEVGCDCVKKISTHLYQCLTKDPCKWCKNPVLDKRRIYGRYGYCSDQCYKGCQLWFGKYKGKCITEVPLSYLKWVKQTHEEKPFLKNNDQYKFISKLLK